MAADHLTAAASHADWLDGLARRAPRFIAEGAWDRGRLVAALAEQPGQARMAQALTDPASVAVVVGQQPAVGGGPLYTLVKAAHAIAVADALRSRGLAATPLFWCASEDHDLGEAGHADLVLRDGTIERVSHGLGGGRSSLRHRAAAQWWDALLARCADRLGPGLGADFLRTQAPQADEGMGAWLCRLLVAVFGGRLAVVEGHRLRPLWRDRLPRALAAWPTRQLAELRQALLRDGRADPFGELAAPPLFADRASGRDKLEPAAAADLLRERPLELSPGAALRPILQQAALPALAYLGGPGELAYHEYLAPLYGALGVPRPELLPRASLALAPSWLCRAFARWQVAPGTVRVDSPTPSLDEPADPLAPRIAALRTGLDDLARSAADRPRVAARVARAQRAQSRLEGALQSEHRRQRDLPPFGPLRAWLFPRGEPQERVMSLFQALWEHGPGLGGLLVAQAARCAPGERAIVAL